MIKNKKKFIFLFCLIILQIGKCTTIEMGKFDYVEPAKMII